MGTDATILVVIPNMEFTMPKATARANARPLPKPPPGSAIPAAALAGARSGPYATDHPVSAAEAAALDFEPATIEEMPTAEEWIAMVQGHCVTLHIAGALLGKTKPEMIESLRSQGEALVKDLIDNLQSAEKTFARFHEVTQSALMRLAIAGSVIELEEISRSKSDKA
jgi:hypothetical protein